MEQKVIDTAQAQVRALKLQGHEVAAELLQQLLDGQAERAARAGAIEVQLAGLVSITKALKGYVMAVPDDVVACLPAMPGMDGDWAATVMYHADKVYDCPLTAYHHSAMVIHSRKKARELAALGLMDAAGVMGQMTTEYCELSIQVEVREDHLRHLLKVAYGYEEYIQALPEAVVDGLVGMPVIPWKEVMEQMTSSKQLLG